MALPRSHALGYVQQSVTTAAALSTIPDDASYAILSAESQAIRWRDDGTNPTTTVGQPLAAGQSMTYDGKLSRVRVVSQTGTATLNISYYQALPR